jgi:hypothetical protein
LHCCTTPARLTNGAIRTSVSLKACNEYRDEAGPLRKESDEVIREKRKEKPKEKKE